jgi:hypothetical protein
VVAICDAGLGEKRLQALRVCPRVVRTPDATALANVRDAMHSSPNQGGAKAIGIEAVNADCRHTHRPIVAPNCVSRRAFLLWGEGTGLDEQCTSHGP